MIVDVSSNAAYVLPDFMAGRGLCRLAERDEEEFVHRLQKLCSLVPGNYQKSGLAYALSKKFVIRFAQMCASVYGEQGKDAEKEAAEKLLPYVTYDLPKTLRIFEETRDNAQNSGYDLRPEIYDLPK